MHSGKRSHEVGMWPDLKLNSSRSKTVQAVHSGIRQSTWTVAGYGAEKKICKKNSKLKSLGFTCWVLQWSRFLKPTRTRAAGCTCRMSDLVSLRCSWVKRERGHVRRQPTLLQVRRRLWLDSDRSHRTHWTTRRWLENGPFLRWRAQTHSHTEM